MVSKSVITVCLLFLLIALQETHAQRSGRRRTGRRKPTTESPEPPTEASVEEPDTRKLDSKPNAVDGSKVSSVSPSVPETDVTQPEKEPTSKSYARGRQFLGPRGTRKPRPTTVRGSTEKKPKPTLPTFVRKSSGRRRIPTTEKKKVEDQVPEPSSSTTAKPSRGASRHRSNSPSSQASVSESGESVTSTSSPRNKRRFGSSPSRRSFRGSRKSTTEPSDS